MITSVLCVALAPIAWRKRQADQQRAAVAAIVASNGEVGYEPVAWVPKWLRKNLGDDYFDRVVHVQLVFTKRSDLSCIEELPALESLRVYIAPNLKTYPN